MHRFVCSCLHHFYLSFLRAHLDPRIHVQSVESIIITLHCGNQCLQILHFQLRITMELSQTRRLRHNAEIHSILSPWGTLLERLADSHTAIWWIVVPELIRLHYRASIPHLLFP